MFKSNKAIGLLPLALGAAVAAQAAIVPEILHHETTKEGVEVVLDVAHGVGPSPQVVFEVNVRNTTDRVMDLPGCAVEPGLHFQLIDSRGRTLLDAARSRCGNGIQMLVPGGSIRHVIDLSRRPLFVPNMDGTDAGVVVAGLRSPELRDLHFVDLVVVQDADNGSVELPAVRVHLQPSLLEQAAAAGWGRDPARRRRFAALADRVEAGPTNPDAPVEPGTMRPLPFPGFPVVDDGAMKPLARVQLAPLTGLDGALDYVPGQLLVTFREGVELERAREVIEDAGYQVLGDHLFGLRILTVAVPVTLEDDAASYLEEAPEVEAAHRNGIVTIM